MGFGPRYADLGFVGLGFRVQGFLGLGFLGLFSSYGSRAKGKFGLGF